MSSTAVSPHPRMEDSSPATNRLWSIDVLRGVVMVIMALDHARDFFSNSSALFDPTDLSRTTLPLFLTRWITHFCAPIFVLLAGSGAYLSLARGKHKRDLSKFLITRGLWLIFLEIFVISPFGWSFSLSFGFTRLQVIWAIGVSMVVLGGLVLICSSRLIGALGMAMILAHNSLDGSHAAWLGVGAAPWKILHQICFFQPWPHKIIASLYPLIPWVGVMMTGYALGELLTTAETRRRALFWIGATITLLFIALRWSNVYGDPSPWSIQSNPAFSLMSFLRCTKYPPSLLYLLMTLGPALIFLAVIDQSRGWLAQRFRVFGRVPLFYYLLHLPLLHSIAIVFAVARYGRAPWLFQDQMALKGSLFPIPPDYGYNLPVVYAVWVATILALYPACRWFAEVKRRHQETIFSYL